MNVQFKNHLFSGHAIQICDDDAPTTTTNSNANQAAAGQTSIRQDVIQTSVSPSQLASGSDTTAQNRQQAEQVKTTNINGSFLQLFCGAVGIFHCNQSIQTDEDDVFEEIFGFHQNAAVWIGQVKN